MVCKELQTLQCIPCPGLRRAGVDMKKVVIYIYHVSSPKPLLKTMNECRQAKPDL